MPSSACKSCSQLDLILFFSFIQRLPLSTTHFPYTTLFRSALLYLAGALAASHRPAEALPFFERALAAGPRSSMALNGLALTRLTLGDRPGADRKSTRLNSSHGYNSYAVFCL